MSGDSVSSFNNLTWSEAAFSSPKLHKDVRWCPVAFSVMVILNMFHNFSINIPMRHAVYIEFLSVLNIIKDSKIVKRLVMLLYNFVKKQGSDLPDNTPVCNTGHYSVLFIRASEYCPHSILIYLLQSQLVFQDKQVLFLCR